MTPLDHLYSLYDLLMSAKVDARGSLVEDVMAGRDVILFKEGMMVHELLKNLETMNPRFNLNQIQQGTRLVPVQLCSMRYPVFDAQGIQICVGDKLTALINTGRYGQMTQISFVVKEAYDRYGQINTGVKDRRGIPYMVNSTLKDGRFIAGEENDDVEHGFKEEVRIIERALHLSSLSRKWRHQTAPARAAKPPGITMQSLKALYPLWDQFGQTPIDDNGVIEESFLHFEKGTPREDIWNWFETQNPHLVVGDLLNGVRLDLDAIEDHANNAYQRAAIRKHSQVLPMLALSQPESQPAKRVGGIELVSFGIELDVYPALYSQCVSDAEESVARSQALMRGEIHRMNPRM